MSELSRVNDLFHTYADADVVSVQRNEEAFANEVFDITVEDGKRYILKVLKSQQPEAIATEAEMQQRLLAAGIGTPEYLQITPGNYVGMHESERFLLSTYIAGKAPDTVTPGLIESFGVTLAQLHDCLEGVTVPSNSMQWLDPERVRKDLAEYDGPVKTDLETLLDFGSPIFDADLPQAVAHGDLWMSNVFAEGDKITTVFDLETTENTLRIIDLARTYTSMRFNSDFSAEQVLDRLVAGYNSAATNPLSEEEFSKYEPCHYSRVCSLCHLARHTWN